MIAKRINKDMGYRCDRRTRDADMTTAEACGEEIVT
jgi:hypothetical protein